MDTTIDTVNQDLDATVAAGTVDLTTVQQRSLRVLTYQLNAALTELSDLLEGASTDPTTHSALERAMSAASHLTHLAAEQAASGRGATEDPRLR